MAVITATAAGTTGVPFTGGQCLTAALIMAVMLVAPTAVVMLAAGTTLVQAALIAAAAVVADSTVVVAAATPAVDIDKFLRRRRKQNGCRYETCSRSFLLVESVQR
jgi:hypothetical protein